MRRLILTLTVAAIFGLACRTVQADDGYRPYYVPGYGAPYPCYGWAPQPNYAGPQAYEDSVRRIMAAHSRYRYFTHPLSLQNAPPTQADYYGWGWGG
ncbi:MAG: hypothetical protein ABSG86_03815 [Thermoguttaceae bacterium]|jgi:hypothetical protein